MTRILATLFALCAGTAAPAGICGPDGGRDLPLMEAAKEAFLKADYHGFVTIAGPYFPDLAVNFDSYFGQLAVVFPDGFDRCETIIQRREDPGFHQDLVLYFPVGSPGPLALLIVAAEAEGEIRMIEFTYNTSISEVLGELK